MTSTGVRPGVKPVLARRGVLHGSGLGADRWVVERHRIVEGARMQCAGAGSSVLSKSRHYEAVAVPQMRCAVSLVPSAPRTRTFLAVPSRP